MPQNKLIIFVKNEEPGKVKTRLAASVGDDKALKIYQKLLSYTFKQTRSLEVDKEVRYSRFIPKNDIWEKGDFKKEVQTGSDLGQRMSNVFRKSFRKEHYKKVVIIGSDCAELTSEIIEEAFNRLDNYEFVLGPANDGGYYLLGMRTFRPQVFDNIDWSTNSVLDRTLKTIETLEATYALLEPLNDVDTEEDWQRADLDV